MKFSDLFVIGELQSLCESFTGVTGAVTAILDLEGNILVATGWQDICTKFHRVQPLTAKRCHESDTALARQLRKGQAYNVYKCKNGLVDVAVPLVIGGVHVANFFTGQFFFSEPDKDFFVRQAEEFGFDKASYLEALNRAPVFSEDKVRSLMDFFTRLASLIGEMGLDIVKRKQFEAHLQQAATVFDSTADAVSITAPDGSILAINRAFTEITGYTEAEVVGLNLRILQSGRQSPTFYCDMWDSIVRNGRWRGELWNKRKNGSVFPVWLTITAVKEPAGNLIQYVGVFSDSSAIKKAQEQLDYQAHHDPLTGLPNRLLLEDRIQGALQRARRDQSSLALLFVDLDRFKTINDTFGHHVGDLVLCEVAQRFFRLTRESDTVARLGGDEFLIVLEGIDDPSDASRIADKILDDLRALPVNIDQEFFIGASIGISLFPQDGDDDTSLIRNADVAMYRAKQRGRNTYEFFTNDLTISSLERFQMETDLHRAIERGELRVYLQPQFSLSSGELIGAEALVRWQHPQRGLVLPGHFIALAEESGLIIQMGQWVQRTACDQWAQWVAEGLAPGVLSINVSAIEFRRGDILDSLRSTLAATRLEPKLLELEITESAIMSHAENSIQVLHELRAMGLSLAIDDFGTGYSSLTYLKRLPLNKLKVDQSFIRGLPGDAEDGAITRAVIALGHSLQLRIIAEGVETEAQSTFLTLAGCDEMQGYLRGRPVPFDDFFRAYLRR
jgi:diguanylate cyclase (GGDEF)-like protein/PAS domain S-box-containing protein